MTIYDTAENFLCLVGHVFQSLVIPIPQQDLWSVLTSPSSWLSGSPFVFSSDSSGDCLSMIASTIHLFQMHKNENNIFNGKMADKKQKSEIMPT